MKFRIKKVRVNKGGYDDTGRYFGVGQPVYWYGADDMSTDGWLRAPNRDAAKAQIKHVHPNARFYR